MTPRIAVVLLLSAACATQRTAPHRDVPWHEADEQLPSSAVFESLTARAAFNEGRYLEARGDAAARAGNEQEAQEQLARAAQAYLAFVQRYPGTGWDLKIRYHAARLLSSAQRHEKAATLAEQIATDPHASPKSRAMALLLATNSLVDAKKLEPMRIVYAHERNGRAPEPRPVPASWQRFVGAMDAYVAGLDPAKPEPNDRIITAAQLAVVAAQVAFATDHMEDARRRLATILERWPDEPAVFKSAGRMYVETFVVAADREGAISAATRVRAIAEAQAPSAAGPKDREVYETVARDARKVEVDLRFDAAKALFEDRPAAAAEAFEALASTPGADVAAALNGAAIAWERAGEVDRAARLRTRILEQHADSWVAPDAVLQLAAGLGKKGDHAEAGRIYREHAQRWPDDANRCTALRNGAVELDLGGREEESGELYLAFGSNEACAKKSPNAAAFALHRAGKQFLASNRRNDAREAFRAATVVEGVTNPDVKRRVAESNRLLRRLGGAAGRRTSGR